MDNEKICATKRKGGRKEERDHTERLRWGEAGARLCR